MRAERAAGNYITDDNGQLWLDMQSGILNSPLGHNASAVRTALSEVVISGLINTYDRTSVAYHEFISLMTAFEPRFVWKPFNTGAEAIDRAIQIAATHFGHSVTIATLPRAFHGKLLSMSWANYGDKLPWGNPMNIVQIDPERKNIPYFDVLIYEPVHGWDGRLNDEERLRHLCDQRGALLIADEMITGFMRCGPKFMNKTADIMVCGKGISQGVPVSLVGYREELLPQGEIPIGWRTTGAGNNLAMSVALATLRQLIKDWNKYSQVVQNIQKHLLDMGFDAHGAFGFRAMKNYNEAKKLFEHTRIIGSWHCPPCIRVGPSFITTTEQLLELKMIINQADEL